MLKKFGKLGTFYQSPDEAFRNMVDLTGRIALVTGAGIGRAIALRLAEAGADVGLSDIDEASARDTADHLRALERKAAVSIGNVASRADVVAAVRALLSRRSGHPNEITDVVSSSRRSTPLTSLERPSTTPVDFG
jgi:3-oxoacyl-[acyl-carrier protein] reductase